MPDCRRIIFALSLVLLQISLQHLPTMQAGGGSDEAPVSGPNKMLSGLFAKAHTQATGLLAKVGHHVVFLYCNIDTLSFFSRCWTLYLFSCV